MADQDVRSGDAGALEQGVQVGREGDAVLRTGCLVAAAVAGAVIGADRGGRRDRGRDVRPVG